MASSLSGAASLKRKGKGALFQTLEFGLDGQVKNLFEEKRMTFGEQLNLWRKEQEKALALMASASGAPSQLLLQQRQQQQGAVPPPPSTKGAARRGRPRKSGPALPPLLTRKISQEVVAEEQEEEEEEEQERYIGKDGTEEEESSSGLDETAFSPGREDDIEQEEEEEDEDEDEDGEESSPRSKPICRPTGRALTARRRKILLEWQTSEQEDEESSLSSGEVSEEAEALGLRALAEVWLQGNKQQSSGPSTKTSAKPKSGLRAMASFPPSASNREDVLEEEYAEDEAEDSISLEPVLCIVDEEPEEMREEAEEEEEEEEEDYGKAEPDGDWKEEEASFTTPSKPLYKIKGRGIGRWGKRGRPRKSGREGNGNLGLRIPHERNTCHPCKTKKEDWVGCPLVKSHRFCKNCVERHFDLEWDTEGDRIFHLVMERWKDGCPACLVTCPCAYCRRKRKEDCGGDDEPRRASPVHTKRSLSATLHGVDEANGVAKRRCVRRQQRPTSYSENEDDHEQISAYFPQASSPGRGGGRGRGRGRPAASVGRGGRGRGGRGLRRGSSTTPPTQNTTATDYRWTTSDLFEDGLFPGAPVHHRSGNIGFEHVNGGEEAQRGGNIYTRSRGSVSQDPENAKLHSLLRCAGKLKSSTKALVLSQRRLSREEALVAHGLTTGFSTFGEELEEEERRLKGNRRVKMDNGRYVPREGLGQVNAEAFLGLVSASCALSRRYLRPNSQCAAIYTAVLQHHTD